MKKCLQFRWFTVLFISMALLAACSIIPAGNENAEEPAPAARQESTISPAAMPSREPTIAPPTAESALSEFEGMQWNLTSHLSAQGKMQEGLHDTTITATFQDGKITGSAGCNNYFASYQVQGSQLTVGAPGLTNMFCAAPVGIMDQETAYLQNLQNVTSYKTSTETLQLLDASGTVLLVYAQQAESELGGNVQIVGTSWEVVSYGDGMTTIASPIAGTKITAVFGSDSQVNGETGCNNYSAAYQIDANQIKIGPPITTRKACPTPQGLMQQETTYLAALLRSSTFNIDGETLSMNDAAGQTLIVYKVQGSTVPALVEVPTNPIQTGSGLTEEALLYAVYKTGSSTTGTAQMVNGEFREQTAQGSASETIIQVSKNIAFGQLPDSTLAAAVVLTSTTGGSGTFYELAIVKDFNGQPINIATTFLGDRIQLNSIGFENGQIKVDMITQGPNDPMCCPTQHVLQSFELQGSNLALASSEVIGEGSLSGVVWKWIELDKSDGAKVKIDDPSSYTLKFLPGAKVSVKADCNNGNGIYAVTGNLLTIQILTMTQTACPAGSKSEEFIQSLNNAASFSFENETLIIQMKFNAGKLSFMK